MRNMKNELVTHSAQNTRELRVRHLFLIRDFVNIKKLYTSLYYLQLHKTTYFLNSIVGLNFKNRGNEKRIGKIKIKNRRNKKRKIGKLNELFMQHRIF